MVKQPVKKAEKAPELSRAQSEAQLKAILKKFDLRVEPLSKLTEKLNGNQLICWQGSAINCSNTE